MKQYRNRVVAAAAVLAAAAVIVVPALATGSLNFTRTEVATGVLGAVDAKADKAGKWDLLLKTKADSTIGVDRLSVASGGHSGWHTHAGITLVTVTTGEVQWYDGANPLCTATTYRVGDSFVEPANHVHLVRNTTAATAEFIAVQIRPRDSAGRIDTPAKPTNCPTI